MRIVLSWSVNNNKILTRSRSRTRRTRVLNIEDRVLNGEVAVPERDLKQT